MYSNMELYLMVKYLRMLLSDVILHSTGSSLMLPVGGAVDIVV